MNASKYILSLSIMFIVLMVFSKCTTMPKLEKQAPLAFENVYYQKWNAGIKEAGSGIDVYIELKETSVLVLDSVYFRGEVAKLESKDSRSYIGRFKTKMKNTENTSVPSPWPFQIKNNECVISYNLKSKVHYFKISDLKERKTINYPAAPSNIKK